MIPEYLPQMWPTNLFDLPVNLSLFRVHRDTDPWHTPNGHKPCLRKGGRFDAQQGAPEAWYAGYTRDCAFSESFFRSDLFDPAPTVRLGELDDLEVTEVTIHTVLPVVVLEGPIFQQLRIPPVVVSTIDRLDYPICRQVAEDIRDASGKHAPPLVVAGLQWPCARNNDLQSVVVWVGGPVDKMDSFCSHTETRRVRDFEGDIRALATKYNYAVVT